MARPTKAEPRKAQLNIGLTIAEYESVRRRAEALQLRPVIFARALLLDEAKAIAREVCGAPDPEQTRILNALLRLGVNLNQMTRYCHRTGRPLPADLEPLLRDIRDILNRYIAK